MIVWSYGGGTQSAAIAALVKMGELPMPDLIVMADTGREVSETWEYLNNIIRPAGFNVHIVTQEYARHGITSRSGRILIPAYTRRSGKVGKLPTFCSNEWKQRPIRRWLREQGIDDCDVWLGISMDEVERMKPSGLKWYRHVYPLIELCPTYRRECYEIVAKMGWPPPPKSRCWMCPNMSPQNWRDLKVRYPEDFEKAVAFEKEIREIDNDMYLHPAAIPLPQAVEQSERQAYLFDGCDSGYCFV
ncbi:hypothetical protein D6833_08615 [Candidatus Parcubacteria bacterium]|nr:MAG: hypothetical protein D6833_08615 [Candidatus Parcubacteria bacterium]